MSYNIMDLFTTGGWVMWPLLVFSVLMWAVVLERTYIFFKVRPRLKKLSQDVLEAVKSGDKSRAKEIIQKEKSPFSEIFTSLFESKKNREQSERALERNRAKTSQFFKRNLWVLGTIGSASPFIGLLGTVVGIVRAFHDMSEKGSGGFGVVAGGISEALVATAAGLIVAIVALITYNIFITATNQTLQSLKIATDELLDELA
jgi:biopolymer transport protein ExbB/TolQ